MPTVRFTSHLKRYFNGLDELQVDGMNVGEILENLEKTYPGIGDYLRDESGALRRHVNIFVGETLIADRKHLADAVADTDAVYIMQALSGG
jgi:molybdopterin converting factor small subunit